VNDKRGRWGARELRGKFFSHAPVLPCSLALILMGCATKQVVVNPAFDFSKVRRISVAPFDGQGGPAATDELVRELVGTGVEVTDARHAGDVILRGSVVEYKSNNQVMVFLGDDNPVVSASSPATPEGTAQDAHKSPVASIYASVGIQARMTDPSNRMVWAGSYSYEGLDLPSALAAVAGALTKSIARVLPQMNRPKSS
jgi:hypothetical protein